MLENNLQMFAEEYFTENFKKNYKKLCSRKLSFLNDLKMISLDIEMTVDIWGNDDDDDDPCIEICYTFPIVENLNFRLETNTILRISKLCKIYHISHEFSVQNMDPEAIDPSLDGYSGLPYTNNQYFIEEAIKNVMNTNMYSGIIEKELMYVPKRDLELETDFFGLQLTLENMLFRNLLDY